MATCSPTKHDLVIVDTKPMLGYDQVIRWCIICGAIVIDADCDGRTYPGHVKAMCLPTAAKTEQGNI